MACQRNEVKISIPIVQLSPLEGNQWSFHMLVHTRNWIKRSGIIRSGRAESESGQFVSHVSHLPTQPVATLNGRDCWTGSLGTLEKCWAQSWHILMYNVGIRAEIRWRRKYESWLNCSFVTILNFPSARPLTADIFLHSTPLHQEHTTALTLSIVSSFTCVKFLQ